MALDLDMIRKDIDQVDKKIVALLEKRLDLVSQLVAYKKESGKAILDTGREQAVLERVQSLVKNPDYKTTIRDSFADLMAQSRAYQKERLDQ